ncbi:MAG: hypothetical protein ACI4TJ_06290 [Candidatus Cryptobacteroides sp.]
MNKDGHILTYILFVVAQMILGNYFHFTPYVMLSILPALVLFLHPRVNTVLAMVIAFVIGLAVDYFAEGLIGINAVSLVPVAFLRRPLIEAVFGNEPFELEEPVSIRKYGFARVSMAVLVVLSVFMIIYTVADCAGTRPFWFIAARCAFSIAASYPVSMLIINPLTHDDRR